MGKDNGQSIGGRVDGRVLSLCSRGIGGGLPDHFTRENAFYSFCYYDAIKVEPAALDDCAQLKNAYLTACSMQETGQPGEILQSIVAIADISDRPGVPGYTAEQIRCFWENKDTPIFFVSMLNLSRPTDLEKILRLIEEKFSGEPHLAYLTFDHCDIIIFGRGDNFQRYTSCIFDLCYAGSLIPEDIITVYGFSNRRALYNCSEQETFRTCIRLGIRDYATLDRFAPKCGDGSDARVLQGKKVYVNWLLGRNDISLCCPNGSLPWLNQVRNALIGSAGGNAWYTTYDLIVLMKEDSHDWRDPDYPTRDLKALEKKMVGRYTAFEAAYIRHYRRLTAGGDIYYPDRVWCRWLKESSWLAVSLIGNPLSSDFGTCLVPQFLDLLEYGQRLFGKKGRTLSQQELETIHKNFAVFFSNTAILVDSLNQTNRQFVQVPAFHLPSFEVPSQIMAYYTAMAYRILNVLKDERKYFYGLSISPKLVNTLSVSSLALGQFLADDEWLDINMDEESFYTLKLTTETLGHEISHFVGEGNRNRAKRKECIIQWAFHELIGAWFIELNARIPKLFCPPGQHPAGAEHYPSWNALCGAAKTLRVLAQEVAKDKYSSGQRNHQSNIKDLILEIAGDIRDIPELCEGAFEQIRTILSGNTGGQTLMEQIRRYVRWEIGLADPETGREPNPAQEWTINELAEGKLKNLFYAILEDISGIFKSETQVESGTYQDMLDRFEKQVCYLFSETFADLQAILLLDMKWNDYCMLLKRDKDRELLPDCPPRMLAVAKALYDCGIWDPEKHPEWFTFGGGDFDDVKAYAFFPSGNLAIRLYNSSFDPVLAHYLTDYLRNCTVSIQSYFEHPPRKRAQEEIRKMYRVLSEPSSILDLQKAMLTFIGRYQKQCLNITTDKI